MPKKLNILLADDEPQVRAFVKVFLLAEHFNVAEASDGVHALEIIDQSEKPFDLLITDIKMPEMDGITLARSVVKLFPDMPVLFISGYSSGPVECADVLRSDFLEKPFLPETLLRRIGALLDGEPPAKASAGS